MKAARRKSGVALIPGGPYQLLRPLTREQYAALKADIAKRGVKVPVEVAEDGSILDGHHRVAIATELGLAYETIVRRGLNEPEKREHVLKLNLARRHMDAVRWGQAFMLLLAERGAKRGRGNRNDQTSATVAEVAGEVGVAERTARHRLAQADAYDELSEEDRAAVDAGTITVKQARTRAAKAKKAKAKATPARDIPAAVADRYQVICGDFATANVADASVDWIITDPPYPEKFLPVYGTLGMFAARVLKPGGSLVAMVGQSYLPEILALLTPHLPYRWMLAYLTPGGQAVQLWDRKVNTFWKPLLWFTKGDIADDWVGDVCRSEPNDNDKRHHGWGQSESGMRDIVERFTYPGQVICDPFCGGGTTGVVTVALGRQFLGIDIDVDAVARTLHRLGELATA